MDQPPQPAFPSGDIRTLRPFEQVELLEILASLGSSLSLNSGESSQIIKSLRIHLRQLLPIHTAAFLLVDPDTAEFLLEDCDPPDQRAAVEHGVGATVGVLGGGSTLSRPRLSATTSPTVITAARISTAVARMPTRIATVGPGSGGAGCQASRWCEEGGGGTQAGGLPGGFCGGVPH